MKVKKIAAVLLAGAMVVGIAGCAKEKEEPIKIATTRFRDIKKLILWYIAVFILPMEHIMKILKKHLKSFS